MDAEESAPIWDKTETEDLEVDMYTFRDLQKACKKSVGGTEIRLAILGNCATQFFAEAVEGYGKLSDLNLNVFDADYNQIDELLLDPSSEVYKFEPDEILLWLCTEKLYEEFLDQESARRRDFADTYMQKIEHYWDLIGRNSKARIMQMNFPEIDDKALGQYSCKMDSTFIFQIRKLNYLLQEFATKNSRVYPVDALAVQTDLGRDVFFSAPLYYNAKMPVAMNALPDLAKAVADVLLSMAGRIKKCVILDLDNTLWGGVIGDDGVDNIVLGPEEPEGQVYSEFQNYLKAHKQLGILLNINSKNDYDNAISGLHHPDSVFSEDDIICIKANWNPKNQNFAEIASELNLLPESLVFVDDNPAERHIVRESLKGVSAPDIGQVHEYIQNIDRSGYFEVTALSGDDLKRNEMYKENIKRTKQMASFENYKDYLLSLEMKGAIKPFEPIYMARIAQLSNKSNQFNLTTRRYTQAEIEELSANPEYITLYGKLMDKFGDNGVVSVVIGHIEGQECRIDLWLMSCRVLKRDMEYAMMDALVHRCQGCGIETVRGFYYPTAKNNMVREFYGLQGFCKVKEDESGNTEWEFRIPQIYENKNQVISVEE